MRNWPRSIVFGTVLSFTAAGSGDAVRHRDSSLPVQQALLALLGW